MQRDSSRRQRRKPDRKQRQLCSQVEQAIDLAFGSSGDPLLQGCWVVDVRPAPTQAVLRVRVRTWDAVDGQVLQDRLQTATPWLRSEVAAFVSRRRVPNLVIVWVPEDAAEL